MKKEILLKSQRNCKYTIKQTKYTQTQVHIPERGPFSIALRFSSMCLIEDPPTISPSLNSPESCERIRVMCEIKRDLFPIFHLSLPFHLFFSPFLSPSPSPSPSHPYPPSSPSSLSLSLPPPGCGEPATAVLPP